MADETRAEAPIRAQACDLGSASLPSQGVSSESTQTIGWGWYLYGITRYSYSCAAGLPVDHGLDSGEPAQMLPYGELAAVVSLVPLAKFGADGIRARAQDAAWLEAMVRGHERVVEAIHRRRVVLPAKFGCVYATAEDLLGALERNQEKLLAELSRLEGCDEWGVRLYSYRPTIERRIAKEDPEVRHLQQSLAAASPGRAYFLQRKLVDVLASATDQALSDLAQAGYDHLARGVVAGEVSPRREASRTISGETEILRAAFLVRRSETDAFVGEVRRLAEDQEGLRCEYSGPWPPYSFAAPTQGARQ